MLNIVYGIPGTPRSTHIYSLALDNLKAGGTSILIVPEQEAISAERKIYEMSKDTPLLGLEVLNFDKLAETVFRKCGSLSLKYISDGTKKLLLSRVLADLSLALNEFTGRHDDTSFVSSMLSQITELKYAQVTPTSLAEASKKISFENPENSERLIGRLNDLSLIFASYNSVVSEISSDPCDNLTKCAELIRKHKPFGETKIYFDSFNGYTAQEFDIISAILSTGTDLTVSLCHPGVECDSELFAFTGATNERLIKCAEKSGAEVKKTVLDETTYFRSDSIAHIARKFTSAGRAEKYEGDFDVSIISCSDIFDECESCAALIAKDIRDGLRYRDISIVLRNPDNYKGIIDEALERYNIPCFFSPKTDICEKSLTRFIFAALEICKNGARYTDIITYLRCGLTSLSEFEIDKLENYASTWKVSGKIWYSEDGFTMNPRGYMPLTDKDAKTLEVINALRMTVMGELENFRDRLKNLKTVSDFSLAVYDFITGADVCNKLAKRAQILENQGEHVLALEEAGLWKALCSAFDELVSSLGDHECDLEEYTKLLRMALSDTDIGTIPQSKDIVTIGDATLLRAHDISHTYMLGCNDGEFPKSLSVPGLLTLEERRVLASYKLDEILFDPFAEASKELFHFYSAACSAASRVTLMHTRRDLAGDELFPSSALTRIANMFDKSTITSNELDPYDRIVNGSSFIEHIPYLKEYVSGEQIDKFTDSDPILEQKRRLASTLLCDTNERLSKQAVDSAFPGDLKISQSATDMYAKCPFSFQCKYSLKLREKGSATIESADVGTLVHAVLDDFLQNELTSVMNDDGTVDTDKVYHRIREITDRRSKLLLEFTPEEKRARVAHMLNRIADITALTGANLAEEFAQSGFKPTFFEFPVSTSSKGGLLPIKLSLDDGSYIVLGGIADRVDTLIKADKLYIRVADYKTGKRAFSLESIKLGLSLQLLIYLFSIWENANIEFKTTAGADPDAEVVPAAAEYVMTTPELSGVDPDTTKFSKNLEKAFKRSGIYLADPEIIEEMDRGFSARYVPVNSKMSATGSSVLASLDELNELKDEVSGILVEIGNGIKSGNAAINPITKLPGTMYSACTFCSMKPVCKNVAAVSELADEEQ